MSLGDRILGTTPLGTVGRESTVVLNCLQQDQSLSRPSVTVATQLITIPAALENVNQLSVVTFRRLGWVQHPCETPSWSNVSCPTS